MDRTTKNDWQRVREIFYDALGQPPEERLRFVRGVCGEDHTLRAEIESLIHSLDSAEHFLETPAVVQIAENAPEHRLDRGEMLRHYEIVELIGSGGMGEVYLARDTRLNRNVAIKLLRPNLFPDTHANGRLLREARAAALLEHPNICHIYEISETDKYNFIVMQYVVGDTLADILASEHIETSKSLHLAIQIVEGLAEAHARGIIHRDIKPANIMVNEKGQAKILDFGLAKFIEAESTAETSQRLNSSGAVMGTVPFMSPEQLRGKRVDARTDIFSFGALFYEMLSGKPVFTRESNAETISAILNDKPEWQAIPETLRPILQKCLAKEKELRYQSTRDLAEDLRRAKTSGKITSAAVTASADRAVDTDDPDARKKRQYYFWKSSDESPAPDAESARLTETARREWSVPKLVAIAVAVFILGVAAVYLWQQRDGSNASNFDSLRPVRLVSWKTGASSNSTGFRVSHDGKFVAYSSSQQSGDEVIYIKQTSDGQEFQVTQGDGINVSPLWSPDDQQIAFVSMRPDGSGIYVSPTLGGSVTPVLTTEHSNPITPRSNILLRHWSLDGSAIFYEESGNLYRLDLRSRETTKVTALSDAPANNRYFSFSPDEMRIVFCDIRDGQRDVWIMPVVGGEPTRITNDADTELRPVWHPDGKRILYNVFRNDFVHINLTTVDGSSVPVQVTRGEGHYALINVSPKGDRIYYSNSVIGSDVSSVNLETGNESELAAESAVELWPALSPDGQSVVYHVNSSPNPTAKLHESALIVKSADGQTRRLAGKGFDARWLPDSRHLAVFRLRESGKPYYEVWVIDTVTGNERLITTEDVMTNARSILPITRVETGVVDFSPDGGRFVYLDMQEPRNVKIASVAGGDFRALTENSNRNVRYSSLRFSPDGSRIAIASVEQSPDKTQKPVRRLQVLTDQGADLRDIYSTTTGFRLIGWIGRSEVILATSPTQQLAAWPVNIDVVAVSMDGATRKLFTLENAYPRTLILSADARTVAFTGHHEDRDDVWTVSLQRDAEPRRITANGHSRLFLTNLTFSADGKAIFYDKQDEINTISMFENFN